MNAKVRKGFLIAAVVLVISGAICAIVHDITRDTPETTDISIVVVDETVDSLSVEPADSIVIIDSTDVVDTIILK